MALKIYQRQRKIRCDLGWLREFSRLAEEAVRTAPPGKGAVLSRLEEVEVVLVSEKVIGRIHGEFMNLPEPTDVITFHHGEIVISVEMAERQAPEFGRSLHEELGLYIIHGLLHLHGYLDKTRRDFERMCTLQERIFIQCIRAHPLPNSVSVESADPQA